MSKRRAHTLRRHNGYQVQPLPRPVHGAAAHRAITAELVRLTLGGQPARPELECEACAPPR